MIARVNNKISFDFVALANIKTLAQLKGKRIGISRFGGIDPAMQAHLVKQMQSREDVAPASIEKILCDNPRQFYKV